MAVMLTLATGRQLEVVGSYEDLGLYLAQRSLSETGKREVTLTSGEKVELALSAVVTREQVAEKRKVGFR